MANINQNPYFRANRSLNGFDMSEWLQFSVGTGMLLPVSFDLLHPGEKLQINSRAFIRTETLTSSAFVRMRYRLEYFFVPFPQLYSYFGSGFYGVHDFHSSQLPEAQGKGNPSYPCFTMEQMANLLQGEEYYTSQQDSQGVSRFAGVVRLLDAFGVGKKVSDPDDYSDNDTDRIPFYWFQAYQRIFDAFYRNDSYTPTDRFSYNCDDLLNNWDADSETYNMTYERHGRFFDLRYRNYRRDYFTNVQPSPLFNNQSVDSFWNLAPDVSSLFSSQLPHDAVDRLSYYHQNGESNRPDVSSPTEYTGRIMSQKNAYSIGQNAYEESQTSGQKLSLVSAASIRQMFAVEKLLSITQRTKKTYEAQTLAHFGYDVPDNVGNKVFYIGSHEGTIQIQDVNATATTMGEDSSQLGEVAGKGIGFNGQSKTLKFTAPWHGVFMAIFSIVPDVIYDSYEVGNRLVRSCRFDDFYKPEYDKLGMSPRYSFEYEFSQSTELDTTVFGYSYNYYWLKNKYDRAWGKFCYSARNWTAKRVMPDASHISANYLPESFFYYSPFSLDDIMLVPFVSQPSIDHIYDSDPFLCDIDVNVKKVSDMSVYGLPTL